MLHLIISNINFKQIFGNKNKKIENFQSYGSLYYNIDNEDLQKNETTNINFNKTLSFLNADENEEDDDFKKKLLSYINKETTKPVNETRVSKTVAEKRFEDNNMFPVIPSNSYTSNVNVPNFESNVLDVKKFYNRTYDNLNEDELKTSRPEDMNNMVTQSTSIQALENDVLDSKDPKGRISTNIPDNWSYKNEMPMNGGVIGGGIVGFDSLESQFAAFGNGTVNLQMANTPQFNVIPHDDLRKPIIYED